MSKSQVRPDVKSCYASWGAVAAAIWAACDEGKIYVIHNGSYSQKANERLEPPEGYVAIFRRAAEEDNSVETKPLNELTSGAKLTAALKQIGAYEEPRKVVTVTSQDRDPLVLSLRVPGFRLARRAGEDSTSEFCPIVAVPENGVLS